MENKKIKRFFGYVTIFVICSFFEFVIVSLIGFNIVGLLIFPGILIFSSLIVGLIYLIDWFFD